MYVFRCARVCASERKNENVNVNIDIHRYVCVRVCVDVRVHNERKNENVNVNVDLHRYVCVSVCVDVCVHSRVWVCAQYPRSLTAVLFICGVVAVHLSVAPESSVVTSTVVATQVTGGTKRC